MPTVRLRTPRATLRALLAAAAACAAAGACSDRVAPPDAAPDAHDAAHDAAHDDARDAAVVDPNCAVPPGAGPRIRAAVPRAGLRCTRYPFPLAAPRDAVEARDGTVYATEMAGGRVVRLTATGFVEVTAGLVMPIGLREGTDGRLYVAEEGASGRLSRIDPATGAREVLATGLGGATYVAIGPDGAAYVSTFTEFAPSGIVKRVELAPGGGAVRSYATGLNVPEGLFFEPGGQLVVAEWNAPSRVLRFAPGGGPAASATPVATALEHAYGVAPARPSGYFIADTDAAADRVVRVLPDGTRENVLTNVASPAGLSVTPGGDLLVAEHVDSNGHGATGYLIRVSGF